MYGNAFMVCPVTEYNAKTRNVYQSQRNQNPDRRVFILSRSAFTGQQRNATAVWSGDIAGIWTVFRQQIAGGLNMNLSGIPYWTTDIGGFFVAYPNETKFVPRTKDAEEWKQTFFNTEYAELFTRWYQFGAFCPIFRAHGSTVYREMYYFGKPDGIYYSTQLYYNKLRYALLPYIYSMSGDITHKHYTPMRALVMDFNEDPKVYDIADQYMYGNAFMVCPVTEYNAKTRNVYLPANTMWYDFHTGRSYKGGVNVQADCASLQLPLYVKAGSIVPYGPEIQYTSEKPADPITLKIYEGANGEYELYEDEGDSYRYEQNAWSRIPMTWNDKNKTLVIGDRVGGYAGMLTKRTFKIIWVKEGKGEGYSDITPDKTVTYTGTAIIINK